MNKKSPNGVLGLIVFYWKVLKHRFTKIFHGNLAFTDLVQLAVVITGDGIQNQCD